MKIWRWKWKTALCDFLKGTATSLMHLLSVDYALQRPVCTLHMFTKLVLARKPKLFLPEAINSGLITNIIIINNIITF